MHATIALVDNCKGLTFEQDEEEWTLRGSDNPQTSPTGEVSILRSCFGT